MRRATFAVLLLGAAGTVCAQATSPGWKRQVGTGDGYRWSLPDAGGRGAFILYSCHNKMLEIRVTESLVTMADPDDGEIDVEFYGTSGARHDVDGRMAFTQHGVWFGPRERGKIISFLRHAGNAGQRVTFVLANRGHREAYEFLNACSFEKMLDCKKPKP